ncbi:hypothetical protein H671_21199 [Cricetulus griseus]|uniref:Uncharacterized protein n=1 Tax=Cricetulus griseus TaxID=10029 RepID=A0A061HVJ8_CRIGR|nr:hypothetical protein H671_21199 [Cricetulus griseus]
MRLTESNGKWWNFRSLQPSSCERLLLALTLHLASGSMPSKSANCGIIYIIPFIRHTFCTDIQLPKHENTSNQSEQSKPNQIPKPTGAWSAPTTLLSTVSVQRNV